MNGNVAPSLAFDHIGIVTSDVGKACAEFGSMIGAVGISKRFDDPTLSVSVQFIRDRSGITYEMIAPLGEKSVVAKALASKTNLLNQVAYTTSSIVGATAALRKTGNFPLGAAKPAIAFGGALVQFMYCPMGFIIELIEATGHKHEFIAMSDYHS
jgi:methylmalonyl-CoA/ethylmalonyl-CoA epimerase